MRPLDFLTWWPVALGARSAERNARWALEEWTATEAAVEAQCARLAATARPDASTSRRRAPRSAA